MLISNDANEGLRLPVLSSLRSTSAPHKMDATVLRTSPKVDDDVVDVDFVVYVDIYVDVVVDYVDDVYVVVNVVVNVNVVIVNVIDVIVCCY